MPRVVPPIVAPGASNTRRVSVPALSLEDFFCGVRAADRTVLGRAFSLVESTEPGHQALAWELLDRLLPFAGGAVRIGVTGTPGAGKSTFLERLGLMLVEQGRKVAVLAVDPSSSVSGGSILGDRTRMVRLSADSRAFIRPSPSGATLGGVAAATRESIVLCEAAGFDVVLVETVGVGQSETAVAGMTDIFVALTIAGAGDELQGVKRGLFELVDVLVVNKADGENSDRAELAARELAMVLRLWRPADHEAQVLACSALTGVGVDAVWTAIGKREAQLRSGDEIHRRRREQDAAWMESLIDARLRGLLNRLPGAASALAKAREEIRTGVTTPGRAAGRVLEAFQRLIPGEAD